MMNFITMMGNPLTSVGCLLITSRPFATDFTDSISLVSLSRDDELTPNWVSANFGLTRGSSPFALAET